MKILIADFESQIVFIDKLFCINKVTVTNKSKKNRFDSDGKALDKTTYALAFHYDNGETSRILFSSEQERDDSYNKFLAGDFTSYLEISKTKDLEMLKFIKTHYEMNGFNELIPKYDGVDKFSELEEWLKKC